MLHDWLILIVPILAYFIAQGCKLAFDGIRGNLDVWHMWSAYGGMPSAHSAFVVSLATFIGMSQGFTSATFAVVAVFAILTIRDAMGFRRQLDSHAKILNQLRTKLSDKEKQEFPELNEHIGHTPMQVFVGSVFGFAIALLAWFFF